MYKNKIELTVLQVRTVFILFRYQQRNSEVLEWGRVEAGTRGKEEWVAAVRTAMPQHIKK